MADNDFSTTPTATSSVHDHAPLHDHINNDITSQSQTVKATDTFSPSPPLKNPGHQQPPVDIEHVFVQDDPREWPRRRKVGVVLHYR